MEFGPYRIVKRLAAGGMGEVFLATLERVGGFQKEVAVKSIHPKYMTNPRFVEFFEREARLAALLNHRHIVQIFDFGRDETRVWLAMEYVDGVDLKTVMTALDAPLPLRLTLDIIQACARALDYAHRAKDGRGKRLEIVHRDISPQNILVSFEGDVKVADFGLAHAAALGPDEDRSLKGKYAYMSPEQVMGSAVDARTDQFSLGTVLYEMLTGKRGFHDKAGPSEMLLKVHRGIPGDGFEDLRKMVPSVVADIVERALKTNRTERYPDLGAMVDDVRRAIRLLGNDAPPIDLSNWLRDLFPNREVSATAASVEATRTALAEVPISERANTADQAYQSDESLDPVALGLATTGPHRVTRKDFDNLKTSKPMASNAERTGTTSVVTTSRALLIVAFSAGITLLILSVWFYGDDTVQPVRGNMGPHFSRPVSQDSELPSAKFQDDVKRGSDAAIGDEAPVDGSQLLDAFVVSTDSSVPTPDAEPAKQRTVSTKQKPRSKRIRRQAQAPVVREKQRNTIGARIGKTKPRPKDETPTVPANTATIDASAPNLQPKPDAAVEAPPKIPNSPIVPKPQLVIESNALTFTTKAERLGKNRYAIGKSGALFQTRKDGVTVNLRFTAPRGRFLMTVQTVPWTNVFLNQKGLGGTPLASFPLASGRHLIEVKTESGQSVRLPLTLSR